MPDFWYTFLSTVCVRVYFTRVAVIAQERLPAEGPVLYVALHRNGAVDGFVYKSVFRKAIFLIAAQLQKNLWARMFFTGIPVIRDKDSGDRGINAAAMERSAKLLAGGGKLCIFPEGTSSLGPRHLPFKSGAARIAMDAWRRGIPLKIVPLGITYDAPSTFRSSIEVIVGKAFGAEQIAGAPGEFQLEEAKKLIARALEEVGVNVDAADYFEELRSLAKMIPHGKSSFDAMKLCEKGIPDKLRGSWETLRKEIQGSNVKWSEAASPFAAAPSWGALLSGMVLAPFVVVAAAINFLPLAGAYWAGKKLPDAPNVITLWRILVGVPLFFLWFVAVFLVLVVSEKGVWCAGFLLVTLMGWQGYQPMRQALVAGWNGIRFPELRHKYSQFQSLLAEAMDHGS